jgi:hypothetical protein
MLPRDTHHQEGHSGRTVAGLPPEAAARSAPNPGGNGKAVKGRDGVVMIGLMSSDPFGTRKRQDEQHIRDMADIEVRGAKARAEAAEGDAYTESLKVMGTMIALRKVADERDAANAELAKVREQAAADYRDHIHYALSSDAVSTVLKAIHSRLLDATRDDAAAARNRDFLLKSDRENAVASANKERREIFVAALRKRALEIQQAANDIQRSYVPNVVEFGEHLLLNGKYIASAGGPAI